MFLCAFSTCVKKHSCMETLKRRKKQNAMKGNGNRFSELIMKFISMWLKCPLKFPLPRETKNGGRWKHQICVEWWRDCNLPQINTWNKHKCHISITLYTYFSSLLGSIGTRLSQNLCVAQQWKADSLCLIWTLGTVSRPLTRWGKKLRDRTVFLVLNYSDIYRHLAVF